MAKKPIKKPKVTKRKGIESHETAGWIASTLLICIITMVVYGVIDKYFVPIIYINDFPLYVGEGIAFLIITVWMFISAAWILPKYKQD